MGWIVVAVGVIVLNGWYFGIEPFKRITPGLVAMNPTTALGFVLLGGALVLHRRKSSWWHDAGTRLAALVVFAIGSVKVLDLIGNRDSGVDRVLFAAKLLGPGTLNINAMAPNTAVNLALTGSPVFL